MDSDSNSELYQSVESDDGGDFVRTLARCCRGVGWTSHVLIQIETEDPPSHRDARDLAQSINGMHRILDLISEQGSGGLGGTVVPKLYLC